MDISEPLSWEVGGTVVEWSAEDQPEKVLKHIAGAFVSPKPIT